MNNPQKIVPWLWFDSQAEEAAHFYTALFPQSRIGGMLYHSDVQYSDEGQEIPGRPPGSVMSVDFQLAGYRITGLNGGPLFTFTPAISFFVVCESEPEIDALWAGLTAGGHILMELGKYDWSAKYGWLQDKYGVTWQLSLGKIEDVGQKITPSLMFVGAQHGHAEEAIKLYTTIFQDSAIDGIRHVPDAGAATPTVQHAQFSLSHEKFMAMDSGLDHAFTFTEALSLEIACDTQAEVDYFWSKLTADGGEEGPCGWLKDKFGVSWQVVPRVLYELLNDPDKARVNRVTEAVFQMQKLDIDTLQRAYVGP